MSFKDLPNDVVWLIFRLRLQSIIGYDFHFYESGYDIETSWRGYVRDLTCDLALISKESLRLVRSKCYRYNTGWLFIKGALTQ